MDKLTRRDLLGNGVAAVTGVLTAGAVSTNAGPVDQATAKSPEGKPVAKGFCYEAMVPDTLDLADRARLAINAIVGEIEPKFNHECWWLLTLLPPSVSPHTNQWFDQNPRNLWALALLRIMTGSEYGLDLEEKMKGSMFSRMQDGLYFNAPFDLAGAWWRSGGAWRKKLSTKEDFTNPSGMAVLLYAMIARYLRDHDTAMRERGQQIADALSRIAIRKRDYAYYPATAEFGAEYSYLRNSGWPDTKEASNDQDDPEGSVTCYQALVVGALSRWYATTGDGKALDTARKLVKYVLEPRFWTGGCTPWTETARWIRSGHGGAERKPAALFQGHQAGMTYTFTGLIDYALVANDAYVKEWVRQGYEYFRNLGLPRIGMWGENIANNQMAEVAIYLRIPKWVDRKAITCTVNGAKSAFSWAGNYLILTGLRGQEIVGIEFPMVETVETYYLLTRDAGPKWWEHADKLPTYILHMKGSTCVKVEFPNRHKFTRSEPLYPVFQRDRFRAPKTPVKKVTRYIHPTVVAW